MSEYVRPLLPTQVFYDASGAVIDYGERWRDRPGRMPPKDTYSVVSHPERFAPLQMVADALIEYLRENYDVSVTDELSVAEDLMNGRVHVLRAVRIVPANDHGASLTFAFTSFPAVVVHAGLLHDFAFPDCGCDACDDSIEGVAGEMERMVLAVPEGRFRESVSDAISSPFDLKVEYALRDREEDSWRSGWSAGSHSARTSDARDRLLKLPDGWQAWPRRA